MYDVLGPHKLDELASEEMISEADRVLSKRCTVGSYQSRQALFDRWQKAHRLTHVFRRARNGKHDEGLPRQRVLDEGKRRPLVPQEGHTLFV